MISRDEYEKAKRIVKSFEIQEKENYLLEVAEKRRISEAKYAACGEHYYLPSGGPLSPANQKTCAHCGHTIY